MKPQFENLKAIASNIGNGEVSNYTIQMFIEDFPIFKNGNEYVLPQTIIQMFIDDARHTISQSNYGNSWRYASGLFVAHNLTLYAKTYDTNGSIKKIVSKGKTTGNIKSATLGDTSIGYDHNQDNEKWGVYGETEYGKILINLARKVGMGGMYVI